MIFDFLLTWQFWLGCVVGFILGVMFTRWTLWGILVEVVDKLETKEWVIKR